MSRSGYSDGGDHDWGFIMYRGAVASAIRGKRGQAFLKELVATLDAMPIKELIAHELIEPSESGDKVCAIGSVGVARGVDMSHVDVYDYDAVAKAFGIAPAMVREVEYMNDEEYRYLSYDIRQGQPNLTDDQMRWHAMRKWALDEIKKVEDRRAAPAV